MTNAPDQAPLLDQDTVDQLVESVGSQMLPIITDWAADLDAKLAEVTDAVDAGDRDLIARLAHPFASSCLQLGAQQLGETMRELEFVALASEGRDWSEASATQLLAQCRRLAPESGRALINTFMSA